MKNLLHPRFGSVPYSAWEWAVMRSLFAFFCIYRSSPHSLKSHWPPERWRWEMGDLPRPHGLAQFFDLSFAAHPTFDAIAAILFYVALAGYVLGRLPFIATLTLFLLHVLYGTIGNSQGAIHHTGQIVALVLFGQLLAHVYHRFRDGEGSKSALTLVYLSQQLIAASYVVTGISKIVRSGGDWVSSVPNIALQFEKNAAMRYYDTLVPPDMAANESTIAFVAANPGLAKVFFGAGLFFELFSFLALWNRWSLALWGLALWFLHAAVSEIMLLGFAYNKAVLLIFFVNIPFWIARVAGTKSPGIRQRFPANP